MISKAEYFFLVEFVIVSNYLESVQPTSQVRRGKAALFSLKV